MRKTMKGILGVVSGVALAIGTATAAPVTQAEKGSSTVSTEATAPVGKVVPGAKVKVKEGAQAGDAVKVKRSPSVKVKEGTTPGKPMTMTAGKPTTTPQQ
jgi:hypothetical protein